MDSESHTFLYVFYRGIDLCFFFCFLSSALVQEAHNPAGSGMAHTRASSGKLEQRPLRTINAKYVSYSYVYAPSKCWDTQQNGNLQLRNDKIGLKLAPYDYQIKRNGVNGEQFRPNVCNIHII